MAALFWNLGNWQCQRAFQPELWLDLQEKYRFGNIKKELTEYGYKVEKISMKGQTVIFSKIDL